MTDKKAVKTKKEDGSMPLTMREARKAHIPQCPECGRWNVAIGRKRRVDFYGIPKVFRCASCGWEREITFEDLG